MKKKTNQQDFLKVAKMNQERCREGIAKADQAIQAAKESSLKTEKLSARIKEQLGDKAPEIIIPQQSIAPVQKSPVILPSWEELCIEANAAYPEKVRFEDLLTKEEFENAYRRLDEINAEFSRRTSIVNKTDLSFLAIATALQVAKSLIFPYVAEKFDYGKSFDPENRLAHNDKSIEQAHKDANDKFRDKHIKKHGKGAWIEILYQTVPYDITTGSKDIGINMGGKYHRMYTLGHDPILGWLFGTANILTDCITFNSFQTNRITRIDPITGAKKMRITPEIVPLGMMFEECYEAAKADRLNLPAALFAQAQHLKSDEFTKIGLPVPILSSINEDFASKLYHEHYDALCFERDSKITGVSFVVSKIIDIIISLTHGLFRKENESKDQFEVRTRKILLISNSIASTSSIINTAITKNPKNLDIGGLLNTVTHLFSDIRFIARIKQEFIDSQLEISFQGIADEVDALYRSI